MSSALSHGSLLLSCQSAPEAGLTLKLGIVTVICLLHLRFPPSGQQSVLLCRDDLPSCVPLLHKGLALRLDGFQERTVRDWVEARVLYFKLEATGLEVLEALVKLRLVDLVELDLVEIAEDPGLVESRFRGVGLSSAPSCEKHSRPTRRVIYPRADIHRAMPSGRLEFSGHRLAVLTD